MALENSRSDTFAGCFFFFFCLFRLLISVRGRIITQRSWKEDCLVSREPKFTLLARELTQRSSILRQDEDVVSVLQKRRVHVSSSQVTADKRTQRLTMLTSAVLSAVAMATKTDLFNFEHIFFF